MPASRLGFPFPLAMRIDLGFLRGFSFPFRGARFVYLRYPGLVRFWILPVLISATLLVTVGYGALTLREQLVDSLWVASSGEGFWGVLSRAAHAVLEWLLAFMLFVAGGAVVALLSSLLAAPFNDALSQEVERLSGLPPGAKVTATAVVKDFGRTILLELRKLGLYAAVMLPLTLVSWLIPGVGPIVHSVVGFYFTAAFLCVDYLDWPAARRQWSVGRRLGHLRRYPLTTFGFGTGVWLFLLVPFVNLLFMPAAVAGGTLLFLELADGEPPQGP